MKNHLAHNDELILASPSIIWQGMSESEIEKEAQRFKSRQSIINRFVTHLRTDAVIDYNEYERFCDLMTTEGVDPILWIDGSLENIDREIEALIENANS